MLATARNAMLEGNYTNDLLFCQAFDMIYRIFTEYSHNIVCFCIKCGLHYFSLLWEDPESGNPVLEIDPVKLGEREEKWNRPDLMNHRGKKGVDIPC